MDTTSLCHHPRDRNRLLQSRVPTARSCPLRAGRRLISRAHVLVRKPHARRWQRLIWAVERRHDVQPPAILAQEVVATRTTTPDGAVNAPVGMRHRRDAEKPRDDHGGHRDDDRPHNRLTLVQVDLLGEPNRKTRAPPDVNTWAAAPALNGCAAPSPPSPPAVSAPG
jgi:hypothetical protein